MSSKKKKRSIRVFAPFKPVLRPEEATLRKYEKMFEKERLKVLEFSHRIRKGFGVISMIMGAFIFGFFTYFLATSIVLPVASPEIRVGMLVLVVLLGVVNVIAGLLLIGET
mgnify:CR=1 FL=1